MLLEFHGSPAEVAEQTSNVGEVAAEHGAIDYRSSVDPKERAKEDVVALSLTSTIVGHVGGGNFHVMVLVDPDDPREMAAAEEMNHRLVERALMMDGTCTGEHGIGIRKIRFLPRELPAGVEVMREIKRALDPNNILNPGEVLEVA